ncbi:MAG: HlyD family type I secretion periplasmic adaptor subunit [Sneathiellales bacterium]|nr:HlyD family type I secretion periplasmic adaptor subunit [Sneathiellales bacterium]
MTDEKKTAVVPTSAKASIILGLFLIVFGFGSFAAWATIAELSSAVISQGTVKVFSNRKKVQTLGGGEVKTLAVKNGDKVNVGDVLVTLDQTQTAATHAIIQSNYNTSRAMIARLKSERDGDKAVQYPADLRMDKNDPALQEIISGQNKLFQARKESLEGQTSMVGERIEQLKEEITGLKAQEEAKRTQIQLIGDELKGLEELHKKGHAPLTRILALKRETAELKGELGEHIAAIARSKRLIGEAGLEIIQIQKAFIEGVVTELQQKEGELFDLQERLNATRYMLSQTEIRATEKGTVVGLTVHTVGGILQPGETLLEIVPDNDTLVVEAKVLPTDIDDVRLDLPAEVQFTAFSQRTTPKLEGKVIYVSADSLIDPESKMPVFMARIEITEEEAKRLGDKVLQPGMPADVFIMTGDTTPLDYLIKPIRETAEKAWREG